MPEREPARATTPITNQHAAAAHDSNTRPSPDCEKSPAIGLQQTLHPNPLFSTLTPLHRRFPVRGRRKPAVLASGAELRTCTLAPPRASAGAGGGCTRSRTRRVAERGRGRAAWRARTIDVDASGPPERIQPMPGPLLRARRWQPGSWRRRAIGRTRPTSVGRTVKHERNSASLSHRCVRSRFHPFARQPRRAPRVSEPRAGLPRRRQKERPPGAGRPARSSSNSRVCGYM